jgi:hypothetical protein
MSAPVRFRDMLAGDVVQLALQPSQHVMLGMTRPVRDMEDGRAMVAAGPAWTAVGGDGRILCCAGFWELWPAGEKSGGHAVAWALLASGIGAAHLAITRFARRRIAESGYSRIEAVVRADVKAERGWAAAVGLSLGATMRAWGPDGADHMLFERVR